jgi:predicted NAD-dependent protein-ADP-ribosyltransferase YbiA (DUF1768 family)
LQTRFHSNHLVLIPETDEERAALGAWKVAYESFVFQSLPNEGTGATITALGPREEVCREPINVTSSSPSPIRLIANFAPTPFELDGVRYACIEAFWQSLRFPAEERAKIAHLDGAAAKHISAQRPYGSHVTYGGQEIAVGAYDHWQLMARACHAKFEQRADARAALLGTGDRPLVHIVKVDSHTIPGVIMADIWMKLRAHFQSEIGA